MVQYEHGTLSHITFSIVSVHEYPKVDIIEQFLCDVVGDVDSVEQFFVLEIPLQAYGRGGRRLHRPNVVAVLGVSMLIVIVNNTIGHYCIT